MRKKLYTLTFLKKKLEMVLDQRAAILHAGKVERNKESNGARLEYTFLIALL